MQTAASPAPAQQVGPHTAGQIPAAEAGEAVTGAPVTPSQVTTATEPAKEGGGGLPQFRTDVWPAQILWLVILFGALYLLLSRVFIPRLRKVKDDREEAIGGAIAAARAAQAEADSQSKAAQAELADARAKAQKTAADAKAKAGAEAQARRAALDTELDAKLAAADARIRTARDQSMASVGDVAASTVHAIIEKLTGVPASEDEVKQALSTIGTEGAA